LQVRFDSEVQEIPESRYAMPFSSSTRKDVGDQFDAQTPYLPHPPGLERYSHSQQGTPVHHIPRRRGSDGDQTINMPSVSTNPPFVEHLRSSSAPPARSVRWNENLICPSPILASQRRQGWFNRRGDQLWTNGGAYKPPAEGHEYPLDLDGYPEYGEGWQNEQGVRIDMRHRLVPKQPLRSALKQPRK